jgi:hypothetical protein
VGIIHLRTLPLAAVACAIAVAACGFSGKTGSSGSSASTGSGSSSTGSTLTFSKCMRANGVPTFPDLSSSGMLIQGNAHTMSVNGVSVSAPAFLAARTDCQKYLPSAYASAAQTAQQRQRGLNFAKCMRSHGVPNFPDPKVISSSGGNQQVYLPGVNPQSPAFQAAAKACGGGPKGPPAARTTP